MHDYKKGTIVFKHSRIMSSDGLDFQTLTGGFQSKEKRPHVLTVTPFARVPVEIIPWYMSLTEFDQLPVGSSIKLCRTVCTPLGLSLIHI